MAYEDVASKSGILGAAQDRFNGIKTPGAGKWYKQLMRDPMSTTLAQAAIGRMGMIPQQVEQTMVVDPEIAAHPELMAGQMNKAIQGGQNQGMMDLIGQLGQAQQGAWGQNLQRRMGIYGQQNDNARYLTDLQSHMLRQKQSWWQTALKVGSPFLGMIPGVGPALAAGAAAVAG